MALRSGFCLRLELYSTIRDLNRVFDVFALVLLADLLGLLLHEGGERVDAAAYLFSGLCLGGHESVVQPFDLLALSLIHIVQCEVRR